MTAKLIEFGFSAHRRVLGGLTTACAAAATTMGPMGRYVAVDRNYGTTLVRDGVSVVRAIAPSDPFRSMGVGFARDVAVRTSDAIGDGTTTAMLILRTLCCTGAKGIASGMDAAQVSAGIATGTAKALARLRKLANHDVSGTMLRNVASVAANGDAESGRIIADAIGMAGDIGAITIIPGSASETRSTLTDGFRVETTRVLGGANPHEAESYDVLVLAHAGEIGSIADLEPLLLRARDEDKALVIVTSGIAEAARAALARNNREAEMDVTVLKLTAAPGPALDLLADLAAIIGAELVDATRGADLAHASDAMLGSARRVVFRPKETLFAEGGGDGETIALRRRQIGVEAAAAKAEYDQNALRARLANLAGRAVVIEAGGHTELEAKERRDRLDCAARAAKAALSGGVVAGAGAALLRSASALDAILFDNADFGYGLQCLRKALAAPMRQIILNAGLDPSGPLTRLSHGSSLGFDVVAREDTDPAERGIVDPVDVLATALTNASSIARAFLSSGAAIVADEDPTRNYH